MLLSILFISATHQHELAIVINQSLSCVQLFVTPWMVACQVSLPFSHRLLKLISIKPVIPFNHLILCYPFVLLSSIFPRVRVFSEESVPLFSGQCVGVSASTSVLLMNIQGWYPLGLTGWISLLYKGLSRVFSSTTVENHHFFSWSAIFIVQLSCPCMTTGKKHSFDYMDLCWPSNISAF